MRRLFVIFSASLLTVAVNLRAEALTMIQLPNPVAHNISVEKAIKARRSIRTYQSAPLNLQSVAQLLWAAQGITFQKKFRTAPSAGALYPLEIYLVAGNVTDLPAGVYHYLPAKHAIELIAKGDKRNLLSRAALNQHYVEKAPIDIVIAAAYERTEIKYGARGKRFADIEVGHAAQNIALQAVSLDLGTVTVGAFSETEVAQLLNIPRNITPLYIIPIGKK